MTIRKSYVDVSGGQIHYRYSEGQREKLSAPIVFIHQTASSSVMYEKMMEFLPRDRHLYAFDTPGFGQSYIPDNALSISEYAEVLNEAIHQLGIKKYHLFGHHTGASFAIEMAALASGRVKSVMLSGMAYMNREEQQYWMDTWVKPMVLKTDGSHLMEVWDKMRTYLPVEQRHREAVDTLHAGVRYHEAYEAVFDQDIYRRLTQLTCSKLFLCGEIDPMLPYFEKASEDFPEVPSIVVGGGGYNIDLQADEIAQVVKQFLEYSNF